MRSATCFAPATVANVAVGFDVLGFSFGEVGDVVTVTRAMRPGVVLARCEGVADVPAAPERNTATVALTAMTRDLGLPFGLSVQVEKGIPLASGMGGSAASAVGAVVAAAALLDEPPPRERLLAWALAGEAAASGAPHADNVAPCLHGGLVIVVPGVPPEVVPLPTPSGICCVLVRPHLELATRAQRAGLASEVPLASHVAQSARLAGFVAACHGGDHDLLRRTMRDELIEPQRAHRVPGFPAAQAAAVASGALACSLSGSGPSVFAWTEAASAQQVRAAMLAAFAAAGLEADVWTGILPAGGARVTGAT